MKIKHQKKSEKGQNPDVNRRWFLKKFSGVVGGAIVGLGALARPTSTKVQTPTRRRPPGNVASVQEFKRVFQAIKKTGKFKTSNKSWIRHLKGFSSVNRLATVLTIDISQHHPECYDLGGKIAAVMGSVKGNARSLIEQLALPPLPPIPQGFFCGDDCPDAKGSFCGKGCMKGLEGLFPIDVAGDILANNEFSTEFLNDNFINITDAVTNAAEAYIEVF